MKAYFSPTMTRNSCREVNRFEIIQLGVAQDRILKILRSDNTDFSESPIDRPTTDA